MTVTPTQIGNVTGNTVFVPRQLLGDFFNPTIRLNEGLSTLLKARMLSSGGNVRTTTQRTVRVDCNEVLFAVATVGVDLNHTVLEFLLNDV
ncbi:hypothetical protein D3C78_1766460 [compost metagenome]